MTGRSRLAVLVAALLASSPAVAPSPAAPSKKRACGLIVLTPQSDDGIFDIRADGASCRTARRVARGSVEKGGGQPPYRYRKLGFSCRGKERDDGLHRIEWRCAKPRDGRPAIVTFSRS
jgi:hypothetical protein